MPATIERADCIVLPSYYREGVPRVLLEAASMGKPIITTDTAGCRDVVDDAINGFLCQPRNVDDLVEKMEKMLRLSAQQRSAMGRSGRNKVIEQFDERLVLQRYFAAIEQFCIGRTPADQPSTVGARS